MTRLPGDFSMERYGLKVRLVREEDAAFILELRTDARLGRFLHATDDDMEKQVAWIKDYKMREARGEEYYFIYFSGDAPIGVNRIYNIHPLYATGGSWICKPGLPAKQVFATSIICREIIFDLLNIPENRIDVRKGNKQVLWYHRITGGEITHESELDYFLTITRESFAQKKENLLKMLGLN